MRVCASTLSCVTNYDRLHNQKFHFTFLQKTYSSKECAQIWEAEWGGKVWSVLFSPLFIRLAGSNDANQQVTVFKELENQLEDFAQENIIIAGDFNCALSENDKKGGNPVWKKSIVIKEVQHLANLHNLTDIWRDRNPNDNRFAWRNKSLKIQCRLDFFLFQKNSAVTPMLAIYIRQQPIT